MLALFSTVFSPPRHLILLVIAAWLGLLLAEKRSERHAISREDINNLIFYGLIAFLLGGRISFIVQHVAAFAQSPLSIVSINPDLFDSFGALATALITMLIFGQRNQLPFWATLDALTPFLATVSIGLGFSHLAAGTAFGSPTKLPWAIKLWSAQRHPSQIYEILASTLILGLLWFKKPDRHPGQSFLTFASLTSGSMVFLGAFRGDQTIIFNGMKQEQVLALVMLGICFILFELRLRQIENR